MNREAETVLAIAPSFHGMHELNANEIGSYVCSSACNFQLDNF
jgi:hypothetical protein